MLAASYTRVKSEVQVLYRPPFSYQRPAIICNPAKSQVGPNSGWGTGRRYGYFTLKLAKRVGPSGKVYANDIVEDFLAEIRDRAEELKLSNIETVLGTKSDPRLPTIQLDMRGPRHHRQGADRAVRQEGPGDAAGERGRP